MGEDGGRARCSTRAWGGEAPKVNSEKPASLALFKALPLSLGLSL